MSVQTSEERKARAHRRSQPHLDAAIRRIVDHGVSLEDACEQMMQFAAVGLTVALSEPPHQLPPDQIAMRVRQMMHRLSIATSRQIGAATHQGGGGECLG